MSDETSPRRSRRPQTAHKPGGGLGSNTNHGLAHERIDLCGLPTISATTAAALKSGEIKLDTDRADGEIAVALKAIRKRKRLPV